MNGLGVLGVISAIIALIAAGTAVVAFTRASYAKATIEALRGDVEDRDKRIVFLEGKDKRHEEESVRTQAALKRIGDENLFYRDLITNRAELKEFIEIAKSHEDKADVRHHEQIAMDEQILTRLQSLATQIGVVP